MQQEASGARFRLKSALKLALLIGILISANYSAYWFAEDLNLQIRPSNEDMVHRAILASAVAYSVLLAIPFVPGVEIAISLILMLGPKIVWLVYVFTVAGLCLSYTVGRLVPLNGLVGFLEAMSFKRASNLLREITPMRRKQRLEFLLSRAPSRYVPFLLRHRYIALALAINLPGNFLIGGGGGIAMISGVSGLFSVPGFVATIALAVLPVPLAVHIFGASILSG